MERKQSADLVVVLQTALEGPVHRPALYLGHLHLESSGGGAQGHTSKHHVTFSEQEVSDRQNRADHCRCLKRDSPTSY
jgi:hypothetical protein